MKDELRRRVTAARAALPTQARAAFSAAISERLAALASFRRAGTVAAYMSFGAEFDTHAFVRRVLDDGKILLLPKINKSRHALDLYAVHDLDVDLVAGVWGIREPDPRRCRLVDDVGGVDFVLVPGVAFDRDGNRLGYGAGYYDRLLARIPLSAARVAAAFGVQVVEAVPHEAHDLPVATIVTESESFDAHTRS